MNQNANCYIVDSEYFGGQIVTHWRRHIFDLPTNNKLRQKKVNNGTQIHILAMVDFIADLAQWWTS